MEVSITKFQVYRIFKKSLHLIPMLRTILILKCLRVSWLLIWGSYIPLVNKVIFICKKYFQIILIRLILVIKVKVWNRILVVKEIWLLTLMLKNHHGQLLAYIQINSCSLRLCPQIQCNTEILDKDKI